MDFKERLIHSSSINSFKKMTNQINLLLFTTILFLVGGCSWTVPTPEQREEIFGIASDSKLPSSFNVLVWNIYHCPLITTLTLVSQ